MSEKHLPYIGGNFDRIIFDGDGSTWVCEYIVELPISGAADEFFKIREMPDMTLYGYPLTGKIVRCRDCKFYDTDWESEAHPGRWWCDEIWHYREPDGFCKWGERK